MSNAPNGPRPHPYPCRCTACEFYIDEWLTHLEWHLKYVEELCDFKPIATITTVTARYRTR